MGNCNCMQAKNEPMPEISQEPFGLMSNIPDYPLDQSTERYSKELPDAPQSLKTNIPPEETSSEQLGPLIATQAMFKGFLSRLKLVKMKEPYTYAQEIPEEAYIIISSDAKQTFLSLGPFSEKFYKYDQMILSDGSVYIGESSDNDMPDGFGIMFNSDGSISEGSWLKGQLHGQGRKISPKSDVYLGSWINGKMHGKGKIVYCSNNSYDGDWKNDLQDGQGVEVWGDGSKFEGNYKNGLKSGFGKFSWPDGSCYIGEFLHDQIHGKGRYVWSNREYDGEWRDNKMHGKGVFRWNDGKVYEGEYVNDLKCGWGVFRWPDGKVYEGNWFEGKQHGEGSIKHRGVSRSGNWLNGKMVKSVEA